MDRAKRKKAKKNIPFRFIFDGLSLRSEGKDAYVGLWTERVRWTRGEDWEWGHRSIEIVSWATSKLCGGQLHVITLHSSSVDSHWLSLFPQSVKRTKIFQYLQWKTLINIKLFLRSLLFTILKIFEMIRLFERRKSYLDRSKIDFLFSLDAKSFVSSSCLFFTSHIEYSYQ